MSSTFERTSADELYKGRIFSVWHETFRYADGAEETREIVRHIGAVGIVAHDDDVVWLVRQPREATGLPDLLEIPAGKLDEAGEEPLQTAQRELAEEIGKAADHWQPMHEFFTSPGFSDERIEIVRWPLDRLDEAIAACHDSKSLIGLLSLAQRLGRRGPSGPA